MSTSFLSCRVVCAASCALAVAAALAPPAARAEATFATRSLVAEVANKAALAALEACRNEGFQVGVAVTDRSGVLQAFVRDRYAGAHTVEVATNKAWTAASFRMTTAMLGEETQAGKPMSGIRGASRVMPIGGGLPIEAGGSTIAAIGVSGAPGGDADERCAQKGIDAIQMDVELQ
ncbi:MAG: heme-binding protein [Burkholderiaceae bacterium]|nr:heme-binding protein [Burkholderiaceae bacterium]